MRVHNRGVCVYTPRYRPQKTNKRPCSLPANSGALRLEPAVVLSLGVIKLNKLTGGVISAQLQTVGVCLDCHWFTAPVTRQLCPQHTYSTTPAEITQQRHSQAHMFACEKRPFLLYSWHIGTEGTSAPPAYTECLHSLVDNVVKFSSSSSKPTITMSTNPAAPVAPSSKHSPPSA